MADNYLYSAALVGGPPWGFRVACAADPLDANYAVQVAQVIPQSRADNERIQAGDVLLTVNGRDVGGLKLHEVQRLLKRSTGIIRLTLRRSQSGRTSATQRSSLSPRVQEIPIRLSNSPSLQPQPAPAPSSQPYRRTRKRVGPSGDYNLAYSSEIEDSGADYIYRQPLTRSTVSSQEGASGVPKAQLVQPSEVKHHLGTPAASSLRTWAPVQFAPTLMSAPVSPLLGPGAYDYQTKTTITSRTITSSGNEPDKYLSPESASARPYVSAPTSEDDRSGAAREEGSLTPKPTAAASSSSTTPVVTDSDVMQVSKSSFSTAPSPGDVSEMQVSAQSVLSDLENPTSAVDSGLKSDRSTAMYSFQNDDVRNGERMVATVPPYEPSNPRYLPDDMAFCAESTCSEHPSLATSSLGIDFNDRASSRADADVDESVISDYTDFFSSMKSNEMPSPSFDPPTPPAEPDRPYFDSKGSSLDFPPERQDDTAGDRGETVEKTPVASPSQTSVVKSHSEEAPGVDSSKSDTEKPTIPSNGDAEEENRRRTSFDRFLATQPEPHYPHAFEPQNMAPLEGSITTPPSEAFPASGPSTTYNPYEPYSTSLRGPNFKATQQPAIWTPKSGSSDSLSTKAGGSRVYDVPAAASDSSMPGYAPAPFFADSVLQPSDQQQTTTANMSAGGNAVAAPTPPPPPPPPPPPASSGGGRYLASVKAQRAAQEAADAAIAADPNRSTVEYPEKQTVASLRSTIATKFNGQAPIKGSLPSPSQENTSFKEQDSGASNQPQFAPSNIDISIQHGPTQTYQSQLTAPESYQSYQTVSNATRAVEDAAANLMSSVVGGANISFGAQQSYGKPLSVATANPAGPGRWTSATPPARPPLPSGMKSPTPPSLPPAPTGFTMQPSPTMSNSSLASSSFRFGGRPDNFARPYERTSIRGTDNIQSGGLVGERRASDGDHYSIPYRETTTITRRRIGRGGGNYKYDDIGPVDASGVPLGTREMVPGSDQRQWYKMMYKKMHQIDRKDDASVLRYRLRDSVHDRYAEERSPRRRLDSSTGSSPQRVGYKFAEFMAELPDDEEADTGGMEFERSYIPKPFHIFGERPSRTQERDPYGRSNRSQSATRYNVTNTPPPYTSSYASQQPSSNLGQSFGTDTSTPRPYQQFQPSRPTDYAPTPVPQYDQEKRRFDLLSNRPQSAVAFGTRYDYQTSQPRGGVQEYAAADTTTYMQRRPISPMRRDEARQWYQSVQTGGDAPFGGFRQPAPERRDSLFRTAWLYTRVLSKNGSRACRKRDVCVQTTSGDTSITLTSVTPLNKDSMDRNKKKVVLEPRRSWSPSKTPPRPSRRRDVNRMNGDSMTSPSRQSRSQGPTTPRRSVFCSPVRTLDAGSRLYAVERAKTKDFHLPFFRLTPSPTRSHSSERSMDWETDMCFAYLRRICDDERSHSDKSVQTSDLEHKIKTCGQWRWKTYDEILTERRRQEEEFQRTYQILHDALKDIEILASPKVCQRKMRTERAKNGFRSRDKSYRKINKEASVVHSRSMPGGLDHLRCDSAISGDTSSCYDAYQCRPKDVSWIPYCREDGGFQNLSVPKRVCSLPELSQHQSMTSSGTWPLKVTRDKSYQRRRLELGRESAETTDVSLNVDSEPDDGSGSERPAAPVMNGGAAGSGKERQRPFSDDIEYRPAQSPNFDGASWRSCNDTSEKESGCMSADLESTSCNSIAMKRESPHVYASADVSSSRSRPANDRLDFDIDEFSRLEKELMQEDERRKRQLKELEDQKAKWQGFNVFNVSSTPQFSPAAQQQPGNDLRGVGKALYNFVAQTNREASFRKGDLIKIRRQVDDHWYEGEVHGKVGIVPIAYLDLAASATGDDRATLTEVSMKAEGLAQALYRFEGKNVPELPLRKGELIVLTKKVDENWLEGKNEFGRRGIFPANYVRIVNEPSSKQTDIVTAYTGSGQAQTFVRGDDPLKPLPNGSQLYDIGRNFAAPNVGASRIRSTAPPQQISSTYGDRNADLISKARELAHNVRKEFGSGSGNSGAEALDAALSAGQPDTFQALFPYKPQNPDELELKENDIVYVVERCDDGWYIGTSLRTGRFGTFPGNYVKRL